MKTQSIRYGENGGVEIIDINVSDPQVDEVQVQRSAMWHLRMGLSDLSGRWLRASRS